MSWFDIINNTTKERGLYKPESCEAERSQQDEAEIGKLLCSINLGPKSALLLMFPHNKSIVTTEELSKRFRQVFKDSAVGRYKKSSIDNYCSFSFADCSKLIEEVGNSDYKLTDFGAKKGIPAAALALYFENKYGISLYPVLGNISTSSLNEVRSPITRSKILMLLSRQTEVLREVDISRQLGIENTLVKQNLKNLELGGVISYTAVNTRTNLVEVDYMLGEKSIENVLPFHKYPMLSNNVVHSCQVAASRGEPITQSKIYEIMVREYPDTAEYDRRQMANKISSILSYLSQVEFLKRGNFEGGVKFSQATINQLGKSVVDEFLVPLSKLVTGDQKTVEILETKIVPDIINNLQHYAQMSADLYYPYSQSYKSRYKENIKQEIIDALPTSDIGLTASQIAKEVGISPTTVHAHLKGKLENYVDIETKKGVFYYRRKVI